MKSEFKGIVSVVLALSFLVPSILMVVSVGVSTVSADDLMIDKPGLDERVSTEATDEPVMPTSDGGGTHEVMTIEPEDSESKFWEFVNGEFSHYSYPINYMDSGVWQDVNTTLLDRDNETFGDEYVATCNRNTYNIMFKDNTQYDDYVDLVVDVVVGETEYNSEIAINTEQAYFYNKTDGSTLFVNNGTGDMTIDYGNVAMYDIYENITERYVISSDGLKHYYIVNDLERYGPPWWTSNSDFVIPITVTYNSADFFLYSGSSNITENCEVNNLTVVSKHSGENIYVLDNICIFDSNISVATGHYYVDYFPGIVTISANISIIDIWDMEDTFIIDPIWAVEYATTGHIDIGDDDWQYANLSTTYDADLSAVQMEFMNRRFGWNAGQHYCIAEPPKTSRDTYSGLLWVYDTCNYGGDLWTQLTASEGSWTSIDINDAAPRANVTENVGSVGRGVKFRGMGPTNGRIDTVTDLERFDWVQNRDLNISADFTFSVPDWGTGASAYASNYVSFDFGANGDQTPEFRIEGTRSFGFGSNYSWSVRIPEEASSRYSLTRSTRAWLNPDEWYTFRWNNMNFTDRNIDYRGWQEVSLDFTIFNSTATVYNTRCYWNYTALSTTDIYSFMSMDFLFIGGSSNASRYGDIGFDQLYIMKYDTYDSQSFVSPAYLYSYNTSVLGVPQDLLYKYDVFVAYCEYDDSYNEFDTWGTFDSQFQVEFYNQTTTTWELVPDTLLTNNSVGYNPVTTGLSDYTTGTTTYDGVVVIDLSGIGIIPGFNEGYRNLRFIFTSFVNPVVPFIIKDWDLWYVKGFQTSQSSQAAFAYDDVSGIYPPEASYVGPNILTTMFASLFGDTEPLAGTRIYYQESATEPSPTDAGWVQIVDDIYMYDYVVEDFVLFDGDYNFLPTETYRNYSGGSINSNTYLWFPDDSIPENDTYWYKTWTINAGFTMVNIQIGDNPFEVIHNREPVAIGGLDVNVTGITPVIYDPLVTGSYDDGGFWNIEEYTYTITGPGYTRVIVQDSSEVTFVLPDDGLYTLTTILMDSRGETNSTFINITNINALPEVSLIFAMDTETNDALPLEELAVGDVAKFVVKDSCDEDGTIVKYVVDFGDGFVGEYIPNYGDTEPYPEIEHVYVKADEYLVIVEAYDDDSEVGTFAANLNVINEVNTGFIGDHTEVFITSKGIPVVADVNVLQEPSGWDWAAKSLWKESMSIIIDKNQFFVDELDDRLDDDESFSDYEDKVELTINIDYFGESIEWEIGKSFWSNVYVFLVTEDSITLVSIDADANSLASLSNTGGIVTLNIDEEFDQVVVVTNPSLWFSAKTWFGARPIASMESLTTDPMAATREIDELDFGDVFLLDSGV